MTLILNDINIDNDKVLDFGSGPGIMSPFFINYVGIDTDKPRVQIAKQYFPNKDFYHIDYVSESNPHLPFLNNSFDVILFNDCIHHISDCSMKFILLDIDRILKPEGKIIIREPSKDTNMFTYFFTEVFENGDYTRQNKEYNSLFVNYESVYQEKHFEHVRDYYVNVFTKTNKKSVVADYTEVSLSRIIIKYYTLSISVYLIYKTVFSICNYK
jgi:SAM-dependent methyltransferase